MARFDTVTVAAIQATPLVLSSEATIAVGLLGDAARDGAQLAVFPETFIDRPRD